MNADGSGKRKLTHNERGKRRTCLVSGRAKDRFPEHTKRQQGDLRHERRREREAEPHAEPGAGRSSFLVAGRAEDRLRQRPRRASRGSRHERRRERSAESDAGDMREVVMKNQVWAIVAALVVAVSAGLPGSPAPARVRSCRARCRSHVIGSLRRTAALSGSTPDCPWALHSLGRALRSRNLRGLQACQWPSRSHLVRREGMDHDRVRWSEPELANRARDVRVHPTSRTRKGTRAAFARPFRDHNDRKGLAVVGEQTRVSRRRTAAGGRPRPWRPTGRRREGRWSASARAGGACCVA